MFILTKLQPVQRHWPSPRDRFWSKAGKADDNDCWMWTGGKDRNGYGRLKVEKRLVFAHRFSYELAYGPIPSGLVLDHLCCAPACVNPSHLEAVTDRVNILRGTSVSAINSQKTHCVRGHVFDAANTRVRLAIRGTRTQPIRDCRACDAIKSRAYRRRKKN